MSRRNADQRNTHEHSRRRFLGQSASLSMLAMGASSLEPPAAHGDTNVAQREVVQANTANPSQWLSWRGPMGNNHAVTRPKLPTSIQAKHIAWQAPIPGRGHSTPIVLGDAIFLTTADKSAGTQSVLGLSSDGKINWQQVVHRGGIPRANHPKNTEASSSLACDGESLFAAFYNDGAVRLTKLSLGGTLVWQQRVHSYSPNQYKYGYAASPCVYGDTVIVVGDYDGDSFLAAMDRATGQTVWKVKRPAKISFSSPIVTSISGRDQLLISGCEQVASYDPSNGKVLWKVPDATTYATCGTMVWEKDRVYASGGYPKPETVCIRADGSGTVLWRNNIKCYEQSMLTFQGYVYAVSDNGIAYCWDCSDGKTMWRQRLGGNYSSSPLLVGDTIYVFNERGEGFAFAASPANFQMRGASKVGDEAFSSPIVVDDTMYLRVAKRGQSRTESLMAIRG